MEVLAGRAYSGGVGKFLLVVVVFGLLVYGVFWLIERRGRNASPSARPRPSTPRRAVAPDDDEEFLRELERRRRRASREPKPEKPEKPRPDLRDPDLRRPDLGKPEPSGDDDRGKGQSSPE